SGGARFVGQRVARHEDARFLTGRGTFVDDIVLPDTLHAAFVRSDIARGTIASVDSAAAAAMPGVVAVFTASDLNPLVREWWVDFEGPEGAARPFRLLADRDVRFVGEPMAMVAADSRYRAEDAAEAVEVDIDPLPAIVDVEHAVDGGAPLVHPHLESNVALEVPAVGNPDLDAVFSSAPRVFTATYRQHRYACVPMETRGTLASWDPFRQELTVWISTQGPHAVRGLLSRIMGVDDSRIRVIMPDVGGAFGQKMWPRPEELAVAFATQRLGRPVKWIEDRRENLLCGEHAREDHATVSFAPAHAAPLLAPQPAFPPSAR